MKQKLIAIDLDGTLLRDDCSISEKNRQAILKMMEQGHLVVPSTGRSYRNSRFVLEDFPAMPYYINANGTTVTAGEGEKLVFSHQIPVDTGCNIYRIVREYPVFIELYHGQDAYDSYEGCDYMEQSGCMGSYREQLLKTNIHMSNLDNFVLEEKNPISKFHIMCVSLEDKKELMERLSKIPGVYPISTASHNIEIADAHWSKRDGLKWLCNKIGFSPEQVIALGDSDNDYDGMCWAGVGVAMENASPRVKKAADFVTKSNEQDGVAWALEQLIIGR